MPIVESAKTLANEFYNDPADPVVGAFFCGLSAWSLSQSFAERKKLNSDDLDKVWHANKEITLSVISSISSLAILFAWLEKVHFVAFGVFRTFNSALSWMGGGVISLVRFIEVLVDFNKDLFECSKVPPEKKREMMIKQVGRLLHAAFLAAIAAWGLLSMLHVFTGWSALLVVADWGFTLGLAVFLVWCPYNMIAGRGNEHDLKAVQ